MDLNFLAHSLYFCFLFLGILFAWFGLSHLCMNAWVAFDGLIEFYNIFFALKIMLLISLCISGQF